MVSNDGLGPVGAKEAGQTAGVTRALSEGHPVPSVMGMVENIVRCKWTLTILELIRSGVKRPGAIERAVDGLTTKVMNERLSKMTRYGVLRRVSYPEVPPRVEYSLTEFGWGFIGILDAIKELEQRS